MIATLAWKQLKREARTQTLWLLVAAMILAIACSSSIHFFTTRLLYAVHAQAAELLGSDLVLSGNEPLPHAFVRKADELGVHKAAVILFPSVLQHQSHFVLASVKAVSANYPLRGKVELISSQGSQIQSREGPRPGTVWLAPSAQALLHAEVGEAIQLGEKSLIIAALVTKEPDRSSDWLNIAPRVFINSEDLAATHLLQPNSRVRYQWLFKGSKTAIAQLHAFLKPQLSARQSLWGVKEGRPMLRDLIQRVSRYVHLAALLNVILAGVAIAITVRHYTHQQYNTVAILRCLGLTRKQVLSCFSLQWAYVGVFASMVGGGLGLALQAMLDRSFTSLVNVTLPPLSLQPLWTAVAFSMCLLFGFALPRLLQLGRVMPRRVLQRQLAPLPTSALGLYGMALLVLLLLCSYLTQNFQQSLKVLYALGFFVIVVGALSWGLLNLLVLFSPKRSLSLRLGLRRLQRYRMQTVTQIVCFSIVLTVLLVLTFVRSDLMNAWQGQLDPKAPNYFLVNIQPQQKQGLLDFLNTHQLSHSGIYASVRGRLVERNGQAIQKTLTEAQRRVRALSRDLNLTWSATLPVGNHLVQGSWWDNSNQNSQISLEKGLAQRLGVQLQDELGFEMGGAVVRATVVNFRALRWDSMQPNFYVVFQPNRLDPWAASWLLSFYLPQGQEAVLAQLVRQFPNVSLIDLAVILDQFRRVLDKMALAVFYILGFSVVVGALVLMATLLSTSEERLQENRLYRILGAQRALLSKLFVAEWSGLGFLVVLLSIVSASLLAACTSEFLLGIPYHFNFQFLWLLPTAVLLPWLFSRIAL